MTNRAERATDPQPRASSGRDILPPVEPSVRGKVEEILRHTTSLDREIQIARGSLLGFSEPENKPDEPPASIEELLCLICNRVAEMVGGMATFNQRLG